MREVLRLVLLIVTTSSTGCVLTSYEHGSLLAHGDGVQLSCVEARARWLNEDPYGGYARTFEDGGRTWVMPFVQVAFGNVCPHPVQVDLGRIVVTAEWTDGSRLAMRMHDPRHEVHPATLDESAHASESFAFESYREDDPPARVCVDLSGIEGGSASIAPTCFDVANQNGRAT